MKKFSLAMSGMALLSTGLMGGIGVQAATGPLTDGEVVARSYRALADHAADYGILVPTREFKVRQVNRDHLGNTHVRMDQYYHGIPVFGEQLVVHLDRQGTPFFLNGTYTPVDGISIRPTLTSDGALELALADFSHDVSELPDVALVILTGEALAPVLSYRVRLSDIESDDPTARVYFVNADSGLIELDWDDLHTAPAVGTGKTLFLGSIDVTTNSIAAGFEMVDVTRGNIETTDMGNGSAGNGQTFVDADNTWGDHTEDDRGSAAADAHYGAEMTWDYFQTNYGRNGLRDNGKGNLGRVHYGNNYVNAFWSDDCFCMTYGDGDGIISGPLVSIDVAGHEMTHGLTSSTAGLIYAGQPGGLNESISDIFGTAVEFYAVAQGAQTQPEYWIGEDMWTPALPNDALRYMDDPGKDGLSIDHMSGYRPSMDVHYSSGLQNNVFFLAAEGGRNKTSGTTVVGIGREAAEAVFYHALVNYMTPRTNFRGAKQATVQAANDLFGDATASGIASAWSACGVR